jgi:GDP-mannose transporter
MVRHGHHHSVTEEAEIIFSIVGYSTCSISMIILNKLVIDKHGIDFPMGLLFLQNLSALVLVVAAKAFGFIHFPAFDMRVVRKWLPLTILFVAMLWTSMKSLKIMSVAAQTIIKNLAIVLTALGDQFFHQKQLTKGMYVAFAMMVLGSYLGSVGDQWVTEWGLFWTFANVFFTVSYVLYMKQLLDGVSREIGRYGPVFYNNLLSLPFLLFFCGGSLGEMFGAIGSANSSALLSLVLMILVGSVMTFATFWCMKMTSPTTYSVTGALNKIPLAVLGIVVFGHHPTLIGICGIVCALSGGLVYTWLNRPKPKVVVEEVMEEGGGNGRRII